jgi:hypothetical protein
MPADPPLADFEVTRTLAPGFMQTIYTCRDHLAETRRRWAIGGYEVTIRPANVDRDGNPLVPPRHGCKAHLDS